MPDFWSDKTDFMSNFGIDLMLLGSAIVLLLIMYFIPKRRRPLINTNSDALDFYLRSIFWALILTTIVFNVFMYFSQPTYNDYSIGLERRENTKDVHIQHLETGKTYTFGPHIYKFLSGHPDQFYYKDATNWIWDNIFTINNIAILIIVFYVFILYYVFKLSIFYSEKYY
ncbi:MAG TPA: hypothetical protein PKY81_16280 [bacterium]|nr:hypothetical protein [bacterium]